MMRSLVAISIALVLGGCISTPNTKALVTPLGGIGIHSFAPHDAQRAREVNPDLMAKLEAKAEKPTPADEGQRAN